MTIKTKGLVACPECDALQREVALPPGGLAECVRCGAVLYRHHPDTLDRTLAFLLAAAVVFACANALPLMELDAQGMRTRATPWAAVQALYATGWPLVALLVLVTVIVVPAVQLALGIYILGALRLGVVPPALGPAVRAIDAIWPWGMVEVFLLGALVSLVKLTDIATVHPGWGLYCIAGHIVLVLAAVASLEPRALWRRADALAA